MAEEVLKIIEAWKLCPIEDKKKLEACKLEYEGLAMIATKVHGIIVIGDNATNELKKLEKVKQKSV